jgi:hypothetical protein
MSILQLFTNSFAMAAFMALKVVALIVDHFGSNRMAAPNSNAE